MNNIYHHEILKQLEYESIYILQETFAQFTNPFFLFSGGKDSMVLSHLAKRAKIIPEQKISLLHIDTGHNFSETLDFIRQWSQENDFELVTSLVQQTIDDGLAIDAESRNTIQSITLLNAIKKLNADVVVGGARRDEEKARAKEKIFSYRNENGQWSPKDQQPEFFNQYISLKKQGHYRVFPLSNWTEEDVWQYILKYNLKIPSLYLSHERMCIRKDNFIYADSPYTNKNKSYTSEKLNIRFRTLGDITCSAAIISIASSIEEIIHENRKLKLSERGLRMDDATGFSSMEERKLNGYF